MAKKHKSFKFGQPPPNKNGGTVIWPLVVKDMKKRMKEGEKKYGTPLQAFNGRNALKDAYEEVLDLAVYLRQTIQELEETSKT